MATLVTSREELPSGSHVTTFVTGIDAGGASGKVIEDGHEDGPQIEDYEDEPEENGSTLHKKAVCLFTGKGVTKDLVVTV